MHLKKKKKKIHFPVLLKWMINLEVIDDLIHLNQIIVSFVFNLISKFIHSLFIILKYITVKHISSFLGVFFGQELHRGDM